MNWYKIEEMLLIHPHHPVVEAVTLKAGQIAEDQRSQ